MATVQGSVDWQLDEFEALESERFRNEEPELLRRVPLPIEDACRE